MSWCAPTRFERQLCNPLQGGCQSGLSCIGPLYRDDGTCAATPPRGALGQFCRATGQLCDAPWVCLRGFCLHTLHAGDACNVGIGCGPGLTCVGYPMATCRDDGTENANCRTGAPACDAGLECTPGLVCVRPVARGGICSSSQPCERASWCVSPASRCAVDGASGGVCRTGGAPCDAGLSCVDGLCARVVDAGEPCDALNRCAEGIACVSSARTAGAVCIAPGTPGGLCRTAGAACDGSARCVTGTFTTLAPRVLDGALQGVTTTLTLPHCEP